MVKKYIIKKVDSADSIVWDDIPKLDIICYPWNINNYTPKAYAKLCYDKSCMYVKFKVYEQEVKAVCRRMNEPVYKDSCVEFFFNPDPMHDSRYFNFEINCIGVPLIEIGGCRKDRMKISDECLDDFQIRHSLNENTLGRIGCGFWSIEYRIPITFIKKYFNISEFSPGMQIKGNFYKCGDETRYPHYGCWNPIENSEPDFHRPEYFGILIFE